MNFFFFWGKMSHQFCEKIDTMNSRWSILKSASIFGRFFRFIWDRIIVCSAGKHVSYRRLDHRISALPEEEDREVETLEPATTNSGLETESDLMTLKITLLGDCQTGKTTFLMKYAEDEEERQLKMDGLNLINKTVWIQGVQIACSIWDVGGESRSRVHVPIACKDAVAILLVFDLTSRRTLNSVIGWYNQAKKWNQTAIPIIIGTKFDDFVRLPLHLQWTIVTQARACAKATKATLFFSSATHNINVHKIFKFIIAKLFDLPWKPERNLNPGEPVIDY